MSANLPESISAWLKSLPVPWLVSYDNGAADASAQGAVYDDQVEQVREAVKARMPQLAPSDALPVIGGDRQLIQGYAESDANFRTRCQIVWEQWALAGTWAEMLYQLYWSCGLDCGSTWIVQQNGYAYSLSANPAVDTDPTTLLVVTELGTNVTVDYPNAIPWWTFDGNSSLCARFAIIISGALPNTIQITARATFDGTTDTVTTPWSGPFDDASYLTLSSLTSTDGAIPLFSVTAKTPTTVTVSASAAFTGYVDLLGFELGSNPFAAPALSTQNLIKNIAKTWKPAKAKYMGAWIVISGAVYGWPISETWGSGLNWGSGSSAFFGP